MKIKRICRGMLMHGTTAALSFALMLGAVGGAFGNADQNSTAVITATAAEEIPTQGNGKFELGGHLYTYRYGITRGVEYLELTSVQVGPSTMAIPSKVFIDGKYRTVTRLGHSFGQKIEADSIKMPDTITEIGDNVFMNAKIGTLYVSSGVKKIGNGFCSYNSIDRIVYNGTQLEELGTSAFSGTLIRDIYGLKPNAQGAYIFGDWLIKYTGTESALNIRLLADHGKKIRKIAPYCFDTGSNKKNRILCAVLLDGVEIIGANAFSSNPNLELVVGGSSVKRIDSSAFKGTKWLNLCKQNGVATLGSVLLYYRPDGDTIDISDSRFDSIKSVSEGSMYDCKNITTLKLNSSLERFHPNSFLNSLADTIDTVYVDGIKIEYEDNYQFLPKALANSMDTFKNSAYAKKFTIDKTKGVFKCLGITYYGENGKGGVSGLSPARKYQIAYKLHEYITTNFYYGSGSCVGSSNYMDPFIDGSSGIICEGFANLYAYLLESAGVNSEVLSSVIRDKNGKTIYNGAHAWNLVEIGGKWFHADVCWDCVDYGRGYNNTYYWFLVSDDIMRKEGGPHGRWELDKNSKYNDQTKLPKCDATLGDANGDGMRTKEDAELIQKYLVKDKTAIKRINLSNSDTNFNGKINMADANITMALASYRSADPLEEYGCHTVKKP